MTFLRKAAIVVAAAAMTIGLAGVSSPASATDTGWDCRASARTRRRQVTGRSGCTATTNNSTRLRREPGRPPMAGFLRPTPRPVS